jgi:two-component system, response regulator FlrC
MKAFDILVVEDDLALSEALCDTLELEGWNVLSAQNGRDALVQLKKHPVRMVLSDVQMPVMDGLELLNHIRQNYQSLPILLMTAYGSVPKAVEAIQAGAEDYLIKPFEAQTLVDKVAHWMPNVDHEIPSQVIADPISQKLYALAAKVAKTQVTILLEGDSGCGKEVLARYIHAQSHFSEGPFEAINCAAIPENMLEAVLFGYEKGAFTGAVQSMPGKFEQAQGGTLLLDEISEMDLALQAKLLRVIQEKEVERLGGQRKIALNLRILATTNRKLKEYVRQGRFREDLYFRLNVFPLRLLPLRERRGDILPLALSMLQKHGACAKTACRFTPQAVNKLCAYDWPGNVRELENVVQRALILQSGGEISSEDLLFEEDVQLSEITGISAFESDDTLMQSAYALNSLGDGVRSAEEKIILQTLNETHGSRKITAEKLGISPRTLRYKLARMKESGVLLPCENMA